MKTPIALLSLALVLGLGACQRADDDDKLSVLDKVTEKVEDKVRHQMATQSLKLDGGNGLPSAELTIHGDLLIDGEKIAMTDAQRALALDYRSEVAAVAEAGAAIGMQGAELATQAMAEAARSVIDGDARSVEQRIEGKADAIRASAKALCDRLPGLLAAQAALAAAVPEFAPYADADKDMVSDCRKETAEGDRPAEDDRPVEGDVGA